MSQRDLSHLLSSLGALSPEQLATLRRELDNAMASTRPVRTKQARKPAGETAFDVASRAGLIGCIKGALRRPPT